MPESPADAMKSFRVGKVDVLAMNTGDSVSRMSDVYIPEDARAPYEASLNEPYLSPTWSISIRAPSVSMIIDPNDYNLSCPPGSPDVPAGYSRPPSVIAQLLEKGISPAEVSRVIITHRHYDHYFGITTKDAQGKYGPAYPNARVCISRGDWEGRGTLERTARRLGMRLLDEEEDTRTIGVIRRADRLEIFDGDVQVSPEVRVISAPGETPGHQIVRVQSEGRTLYCIGDLYHHQVEIEHPEWMVRWADPGPNIRSRRLLAEAASSEDAVVIAGHLPIGRIERTATGFRWAKL
jgi:glyoxylase-like metal-dependent hydrolase (beta-lactamase superfamily II)